jgi:hypothetical protein
MGGDIVGGVEKTVDERVREDILNADHSVSYMRKGNRCYTAWLGFKRVPHI